MSNYSAVCPFAMGSLLEVSAFVEWLEGFRSKADGRYLEILHDDLVLLVSLGKIWQVLAGRARWLDAFVEFEVLDGRLVLAIHWTHAHGGGHVRLVSATIIRWVERKKVWESYDVPATATVAVVALRSKSEEQA
jgi:hypothetical protein